MKKIKPNSYMTIKDFVETGYLQEANRRFFHPHGLALEVTVDDDDNYSLSGIWDYRDDEEGIVYDAGYLGTATALMKASKVYAEYLKHAPTRIEMFNDTVQPLGNLIPNSEGKGEEVEE